MPPEPVKVLLVDDEPLVRRGLQDVIDAQPGVTIVGQAGDGLAALEACERLQPHLLFLDVQMPGLDGFGVLQHLDPRHRPAIVFVTAYEQYALRAFDAHAVDYLQKPFDDARLLVALGRALSWVGRAPAAADPLRPLLEDVARARRRDRFVVKQAGRLRLVRADEVEWIEARGNYVHLHHPDGPFLLRETLTSLAATLDPRRFVRVHRSAIVAIDRVLEVGRPHGGDQELRLGSGARVPLGRRHRGEFGRLWRDR